MRLLLAALLATMGAVFVAPPAQAASQAVMMENYSYSPSTLTVRVGDTVTWTNHDQAPHDVTTTSAPVAIKSPLLSTGQSFSYTFTTPGTYSYYCSIHPDMRAQVIVQPAPAAAAPATTAPKSTPKPTTAAPKTSAVAQAPVAQQPTPSMSMPAQSEAPAGQVPAATPEQPAVAAGVAPTATTSLDPMLIVAGVAAGIAVLCLLVLGSRRQT